MTRSIMIDLLNAARMLFAPNAFLAAEDRNMEVANAQRRGAEISDRAASVRRAFWLSAVLVAAAFVVGAALASVAKAEGYALIPSWQLRLQAMSAAILLWGTVLLTSRRQENIAHECSAC